MTAPIDKASTPLAPAWLVTLTACGGAASTLLFLLATHDVYAAEGRTADTNPAARDQESPPDRSDAEREPERLRRQIRRCDQALEELARTQAQIADGSYSAEGKTLLVERRRKLNELRARCARRLEELAPATSNATPDSHAPSPHDDG